MYHLTRERRRLILIGNDFETMERIAESAWLFFDSHSVEIKIDIAVKVDRALILMKYYEYNLAILCAGSGESWEWPKFAKGYARKEQRVPFMVYASGESAESAPSLAELKPMVVTTPDSFDTLPSLIDETILEFESAKEGSNLIARLKESITSIKSVNDQVAGQSAKILKLKNEQELQQKKLEGMLEFSQELAILDMDLMVKILKKRLPKIFGIELFSIFSLKDCILSLIATNNPKIIQGVPVTFKLNASPLMKEAAEAGKPVIVDDFSNSNFASGKHDNYSDEFAISIPIMRDNEVIGIINMNGNRLGFFDHPDLTFVRLCVELLSGALSNAMQHKLIEQMAITDGQTGLYNNRYFYKVLGEEWEKVGRYSRHFSLIIVDIDFFKKVNDTYGHLSGDKVLSQLSKILIREARKVDTVARYGGEEFTVLLPETPVEEARFVAERMRKAVEDHEFEGDGMKLSITASFGVADTRNSNFGQGEDLIKSADGRLYAAKETGRNKVVSED